MTQDCYLRSTTASAGWSTTAGEQAINFICQFFLLRLLVLLCFAFAATNLSSYIPDVLMQTFWEYAGAHLHHKYVPMGQFTCSLQLAMHLAFALKFATYACLYNCVTSKNWGLLQAVSDGNWASQSGIMSLKNQFCRPFSNISFEFPNHARKQYLPFSFVWLASICLWILWNQLSIHHYFL